MTVVAAPDGCVREDFAIGSIYYNDDQHAYYRCKPDGSRGKRLTSVSTLVGPFGGNPDRLIKWGADMTIEGITALLQGRTVPDTPAKLRALLDDAESSYEQIKDQAAQRGSMVHEVFEALAGAKEFPSLADASDTEIAMCEHLERWWREVDPEPLNVEQMVYSAEHGYAGRFDLRARVKGEVYLIDLKTSKRVYAKQMVQLAGYDYAAIECGVGASDVRMLLNVTEHLPAREVESRATHEDFLAALRIYRRAAELQRAA